jgi:hypothetical protein
MADNIYTPLQLIAGAGMMANVGIRTSPVLTSAVSSYNSNSTIQKLLSAQALAGSFGLSASTITALKTIGASTCPALGASVPTAYANTTSSVLNTPVIPAAPTGGFGTLVTDTANRYLGSGDLSKFCTVYSTVFGWQLQSAQVVYSTVNATQFLGPTFSTMDDLITGEVTKLTLAVPALATDTARMGLVINTKKLTELGTPTSLLQQLSAVAGIVSGTLPSVYVALAKKGLTNQEIIALCTPDASNLDLTRAQLNSLQTKAYAALGTITDADLQEVLDILKVTTPGITTMQDLLNPKVLFKESWPSLTTPTQAGSTLIYNPDGSVNSKLANFLNTIEIAGNNAAAGCDELAKIVPAEQAIASVALAVSMSQLKNISGLTMPQFAGVLA